MCQCMEEKIEKKEFVKQYVLNRARAIADTMDAEGAVKKAIIAWEEIQFRCK